MKEEKKKVTDVSLWSVLESVLCLSKRSSFIETLLP